jgi:hypothetical protein
MHYYYNSIIKRRRKVQIGEKIGKRGQETTF